MTGKPIELKIEQTNKEITDLEKSLKTQNIEIGANEIVRTTAVAQKAMEELNQAMIETEIKKATKEAGEASKKPIELKIEQTNKEITDLEKSLKAQNVEIGANEIVRTTAVAQKQWKN